MNDLAEEGKSSVTCRVVMECDDGTETKEDKLFGRGKKPCG